jgi:membrane protein
VAAGSMTGKAGRSGLSAAIIKTARDVLADDIPSVAAGVTFYTLLAIFPGLSAMMSLYGLFADVGEVRHHVLALQGLLPGGAVTVLGNELRRLAEAEHGGLSLTFALSLAISLWSANAGARALLKGLTVAYETRERRGPVALTLTALAFTVGGILFGVVLLGVVASAPAVAARLGIDAAIAFQILKWPLLLLVVVGGLVLLYARGPDPRQHSPRVVLPGALAAALGWAAMSLAFSWYVARYGQFDRTFGALGAVAGFMTWIWLSMMVILTGAELNAAVAAARSGSGSGARR